jgi:hypothetical protein
MLLKRIKNFENYWISLNGDVWSDKRNNFIKPQLRKDGYFQVCLRKDKKNCNQLLHRLLADAFIENPNNFPITDHIDKNKLNNDLNNLRWTTQQKNCLNKTGNVKETNIYFHKKNNCYEVKFNFKQRIRKTFKTLEEAIKFRNETQEKIDKY